MPSFLALPRGTGLIGVHQNSVARTPKMQDAGCPECPSENERLTVEGVAPRKSDKNGWPLLREREKEKEASQLFVFEMGLSEHWKNSIT